MYQKIYHFNGGSVILRLIILIFLIFTYHEIQEINMKLTQLQQTRKYYDSGIFDERQLHLS